MARKELVEMYFGRPHEDIEPYHQQLVELGLPIHHNTVSQVRGGHTSGNESIFRRLLLEQGGSNLVNAGDRLKDRLYARIAVTGIQERKSNPKYPDKFLINGFTTSIAEELKIKDPDDVAQALQAMTTEYLLETPEDEPIFQVEVNRFLTAQTHPPSFRAAQIWSGFETDWDGTRYDFFQFLNQTGKYEPKDGKKPSGRLSASWTPTGVSVLAPFYLKRLIDTMDGNVGPTKLDMMLQADYVAHNMVTRDVIAEINKLTPTRFNDEMARTHLVAIATGDVNDRINYH